MDHTANDYKGACLVGVLLLSAVLNYVIGSRLKMPPDGDVTPKEFGIVLACISLLGSMILLFFGLVVLENYIVRGVALSARRFLKFSKSS